MKRILCLLLVLVLASLALPATALAWHASPGNCKVIDSLEDWFYNYDFESYDADGDHVDWPVNLLYIENADKDKVFELYWGGSLFGSAMYMLLDDGEGATWVADCGTKEDEVFGGVHLRVYGVLDTQGFDDPMFWYLWLHCMYNDLFGYYVVGTSHKDHNELLPNGWSGYSEDAEDTLVFIAALNGKDVDDGPYWDNEEPFRIEHYWWKADHIWDNNGRVSVVWMP